MTDLSRARHIALSYATVGGIDACEREIEALVAVGVAEGLRNGASILDAQAVTICGLPLSASALTTMAEALRREAQRVAPSAAMWGGLTADERHMIAQSLRQRAGSLDAIAHLLEPSDRTADEHRILANRVVAGLEDKTP